MFKIKHAFSRASAAAVVVTFTALAAWGCSDDRPNGEPEEQAGGAGRGGAAPENAGAPNPGSGGGGGGTDNSSEAGASPNSGAAGSEATSQGGEGGSGDGAVAGGSPSTVGGWGNNEGEGGSRCAEGETEAAGDLFTLEPASAECAASLAPCSAIPVAAAGLMQPPSSGQNCDSSFEPNDAAGQACKLTLDTAIASQISGSTDATDNFVFHAEAGVKYTLLLSALNCVNGVYAISVTANSLNATGQTQQLYQNVYFGTRRALEVVSNTTGDMLLTLQTTQTCQYELEVVPPTAQGLAQDAQYEPNDTPSTGSLIPLNHLVQTSLTSPSDTVDHFSFPAQANVTYSVHVSLERCDNAVYSISLSGWSLGSGAPVTNLGATALYFGRTYTKELTSATSGLQVLALSTTASCEYSLYVVPSTVCGLGHGADHEPNDTPSTAAPIAIDQTVTAELMTRVDDTDYYVFPVLPKTKYTLTVSTSECINSLYSLYAKVSSGRGEGVNNGEAGFSYGAASRTLSFTSGNATQELLSLTASSSSCNYTFSISKG